MDKYRIFSKEKGFKGHNSCIQMQTQIQVLRIISKIRISCFSREFSELSILLSIEIYNHQPQSHIAVEL